MNFTNLLPGASIFLEIQQRRGWWIWLQLSNLGIWIPLILSMNFASGGPALVSTEQHIHLGSVSGLLVPSGVRASWRLDPALFRWCLFVWNKNYRQPSGFPESFKHWRNFLKSLRAFSACPQLNPAPALSLMCWHWPACLCRELADLALTHSIPPWLPLLGSFSRVRL